LELDELQRQMDATMQRLLSLLAETEEEDTESSSTISRPGSPDTLASSDTEESTIGDSSDNDDGLETSSETSDSVPEEPRARCSVQHVNRRPLDGECLICREDCQNVPLEELVWCKSTCGHNFHKECLEEWRPRAERNQGVLKCPLW
jgi:hypothetical protein